jgi:two-component system, cell cycle response regulator CpdR
MGKQISPGEFRAQSKGQARIVDHSEDPLIGSRPNSPLRVLYIEDNQIVREVTSELLLKNDRQIVALGTAEEALREFSEQAFDIVITDVSLPAMSGLDLARNILTLKPRTSIIVASGYFLDLSLQKWGPNVRAIIKPFDVEQIDALIDELCACPDASGAGSASLPQ